jgi:hypothetical protein
MKAKTIGGGGKYANEIGLAFGAVEAVVLFAATSPHLAALHRILCARGTTRR